MSLIKRNIQSGTKIQYLSRELLFLAKSGQPYRGTLYVNFTSLGETIDLVAFKKYITSLRSVHLNAEDIAFEIHSTINNSIKTDNLGVMVDLSARGGLQQRLAYGEAFEVVVKKNIFQI